MATTHAITLVLPEGKEVTLHVDEATFIFDAAAAAGMVLPHTCLQGWCLSCAGRVSDGSAACVDHRAALRYYPEDEEGGFVLLCTARPRRRCRIRTHQAAAMKSYRSMRGLPAPGG